MQATMKRLYVDDEEEEIAVEIGFGRRSDEALLDGISKSKYLCQF
jgi:hypothetical protein